MGFHLRTAGLIGACITGVAASLLAQSTTSAPATASASAPSTAGAASASAPATTSRPTTREARSPDEVKKLLGSLATENSITLSSVEDRDGELEVVLKTTTARLGRMLAQMSAAELEASKIEIATPKPGIDDLDVHLRVPVVPPPGMHKLEFVSFMADLTAAFPNVPDAIWATSLDGDSKSGNWDMNGQATTQQEVQTLLNKLRDHPHFDLVRLVSLKYDPNAGKPFYVFRMTFHHRGE